MVAKGFDVDRVHPRVIGHVGEEDGGLGHIVQRRALRFEVTAQVLERLSKLRFQAAAELELGVTICAILTGESASAAGDATAGRTQSTNVTANQRLTTMERTNSPQGDALFGVSQ